MSATETANQIPVGTWRVDKAHTKAGFAVKHMGVTTVRGEFRDFDGYLEVTGEGLKAHGTVQAASVDTGQEARDEHLRSADFFEVDAYPELTFESNRIEAVDEDSFRIVGDLTMHGVTREVELDAELGGIEVGMQEEDRVGLDITGSISRKDFGMKFNAALGSGNAVVADKVRLVLDVAAVRDAA